MDKTLFERYIAEMRAMQTAATVAPPPTKKPVQRPIEAENPTDMEGVGRLVVIATSVRGIYPVENARVTVFSGEGNDQKIISELSTDQSGKTQPFLLATPKKEYAEAPEPAVRPFALYNVKTEADGFVTTENYNVAVFDGVTSLQNVELVPISSKVGENEPIIIDEFENYPL